MKKEKKKRFSIAQAGYLLFCSSTMLLYMAEPVFAATIWEKIVSRFFRKNKSGHLVAGSQPAMISDSRSSSAFKR